MNSSLYPALETKLQPIGDKSISTIKETRDQIIERLLNEDTLRTYLQENHHLPLISAVKLNFIQRALKELYATPVDLVHYSQLIMKIKGSDSLALTNKNEMVFYQDIEHAICNYL